MDFTAENPVEKAREYIDAHLKPSRAGHIRGVVKKAQELVRIHAPSQGIEELMEKATIASWFHDIARGFTTEELDGYVDEFGLDPGLKGRPELSHSKVGAEMMKRWFDVDDREIIDAVSYHTTGRAGMDTLEKIVFLADAVEDGRDYPGVEEIRMITETDLDRACLRSLDNTIKHVSDQGNDLDQDTVRARDDLAARIKDKEK